MKEKLSVRKVYRNTYRYIMSHLFAFAFLTIFYFLGEIPPLLLSAPEQPFNIFYQFLSLVYMYVFFYFAAGCYFRQQLLWDWKIFALASLRFLIAIVLFCFSVFVASLIINIGIYMLRMFFGESGTAFAQAVLGSTLWLIGKYLIIFMLFVVFFIVPSFAFVSEITGRSRSLLMTYVKTKGSLLKIALVSFSAWVLLLVLMIALTYVHILLALIARAAIFAFVSILYFKMYDFFYNFPTTPKRDASGRFIRKIEEDDTASHIAADTEDVAIANTSDEISGSVAVIKQVKVSTGRKKSSVLTGKGNDKSNTNDKAVSTEKDHKTSKAKTKVEPETKAEKVTN